MNGLWTCCRTFIFEKSADGSRHLRVPRQDGGGTWRLGHRPAPPSPPSHVALSALYAHLCGQSSPRAPNSMHVPPSQLLLGHVSPQDVGYSRDTDTEEALRGQRVRQFWIPAPWILLQRERPVLLYDMPLGHEVVW